MYTILNYLMLLLTGMVLQSQNTIEVSMTNLGSDTGPVMVGLYNEETQFLEKEYKVMSSTISEREATVTMTDIPDGVYAISCYHDENSNGAFDMFMGVFPKEPYACSNGAKGTFGPPKWEVAKFEVGNGEVKKVPIIF